MLQNDYPQTLICQVLNLSRSTLYYLPQTPDEIRERQAISAVAEQFPTYGSRRVSAQLRREPYRLSFCP